MKFESLYEPAYWFLLFSLVVGAGSTFIMLVGGKEKDEILQAKLADANESAAKANERAEQIKKELSWRRLTSEQRKTLVSQLRAFPSKLSITWQSGDIEASVLAEDISFSLKEAGWDIEASPLMWALDKVRFDISVSRTDDGDSDRLIKSLLSVGVTTELDAPAKHFTLFIGSKPPM